MKLPDDLKNYESPKDWGLFLWRACDVGVCVVLFIWVVINFLSLGA